MPDQTIQALEAIKSGAYVYNYDMAQTLRNIERIKQNCVIILGPSDIEFFLIGGVVRSMTHKKKPYFWAELTLEGQQYLYELKKESCPK